MLIVGEKKGKQINDDVNNLFVGATFFGRSPEREQ